MGDKGGQVNKPSQHCRPKELACGFLTVEVRLKPGSSDGRV